MSGTVPAMNLDGKVAVVTGATRGVGRGVGRELAQHGARVFVTGRSVPDREPLDERTTGIRCDHRVEADVTAAFEDILKERGAIDILVNNVWGGYERMIDNGEFTWPRPFWEQPLWRWDAMFGAGVRAHYHASQLAAPSMVAHGRGLIVHISSVRAHLRDSAHDSGGTMQIRPPEWRLRADCPCGEGALLLVACPACEHVAAVCEEEGTAFVDARVTSTSVAADAETTACPRCAGCLLKEFSNATSDQDPGGWPGIERLLVRRRNTDRGSRAGQTRSLKVQKNSRLV